MYRTFLLPPDICHTHTHHTTLHVYQIACDACVKWKEVWSVCFEVNFGVRQGSVLSPYLFNIYLDDVANLNKHYKRSFIVIYADDILLIAVTVSALESLLRACESELQLDMSINVKKSSCIVIVLLVLVLRPITANPCIGCLSLDIWEYSLFHHGLSNVHLLCHSEWFIWKAPELSF